ncbi:WD40 repeat-like protein [Dacryopinax primogenitus]|uniref:WD40 repeat-like protein n=1 Tax=Dacryopinax primogenitus (strain DJM 731) TaxID=1858805 RepID=M5GEQ2_DACPD|nr:WD40 repeat-like protein [Dacryopinax primogenitus]EJU03473.1 WD40 repeat-like protein [Dacryopinax primogenitus]
MSSGKDRRAEIEAKKAKLAELRRMREERKAASLAEAASRRDSEIPTSTPASRATFTDVNDLVASLIGPRSEAGVGTSTDLPHSRGSIPPSPGGGRVPTPALGVSGLSSSARESDAGSDRQMYGSAPSGLAHDSSGHGFEPSPMRVTVDLIDVEQDLFEFPQKQKVMYNKEIQTADLESDDEKRPSEDEIRIRIQKEEAERAARERDIEEESIRMEQELVADIRVLTEEERLGILQDPGFIDFVDQSSKIVQRALQDRYDYTRDYRISTDVAADELEGEKVKRVCAFFDDRWTKNRSVTDVDWSHKFPELCVAAYNKNPSALNDPDGVVLVWNMHLLERPEFVLHSQQSDVLAVRFSPYQSNLIFGGTYSGEILLWDTRHGRHLPVLKTTRSSIGGHFYPVYNMQVVGTQNAHNLITADTDGKVNSWLVDMLAQPQDFIQLTHNGHSKTDDVAVSAMDFPPNETSMFYVGTEEGSVYQALRHDRAGVKAGLHNADVYRSHRAPVTSLSCNKVAGAVDFSDLFLTASMDWKIKLWRGRAPAAGQVQQLQQGQQAHEVHPLHTFDGADEPVYDVKWHPQNPALFGAVDGSGKFDLWNLNADTDVPTVSTSLSNRALNKLVWESKEGRRAAIGSSEGRVHIVDIGELAIPRESEWTDMQRVIAGMPIAREMPIFLEGEGRGRVSSGGMGYGEGGRGFGGYDRRTSAGMYGV